MKSPQSVLGSKNTFKGQAVSADLVTYSNTQSHCEAEGGYVLSGYTRAIRAGVMKFIVKWIGGDNIYFYIGADMEYSVKSEPDRTKRCAYSVPSLNCIYKWNQGLWANALGDGSGVGFYKGNDPSVTGAGVINGYDVTIHYTLAVDQRPRVSRDIKGFDNFVFFVGVEGWPPGQSPEYAQAVCEVQDGTIDDVEVTTTTEAPTTTTSEPQGTASAASGAPEKLDDESGWSNGLIAVVVVVLILFVILAIVLCLYFCECICRRKADGCRAPEDSIAMIHIDHEGSVMHRKRENSDMSIASSNRMNPLIGEDEQGRREIRRNTWIETPQQANALVRANSAVPSGFDSAAEQQSRRRSSMRRTRSNRRALSTPGV